MSQPYFRKFRSIKNEQNINCSVVLPTAINEDETVAEFKNGVLTITAPKTDDAKPRKISIMS